METVAACNLCHSQTIRELDRDYNFCQCGACGYVFDSPRPTLDEIVAFYSQESKYDSWVDAAAARDALWKRRLEKLLPHRAEGNLLDVGTGIGQFLHHARPHFTDVQGTEVSASAVRVAQEKYGLKSIRDAWKKWAFLRDHSTTSPCFMFWNMCLIRRTWWPAAAIFSGPVACWPLPCPMMFWPGPQS